MEFEFLKCFQISHRQTSSQTDRESEREREREKERERDRKRDWLLSDSPEP